MPEQPKLHSVPKPRISTNINDFNRNNAEAYFPQVKELLDHTTQIEFLIPGCIPRGNIILMSGAPFKGKTWAAYSAAYAVASGTPWMGRGEPAQQGMVAICNYDQPTDTMGVRIRDVGITENMPVHVHTFGLTRPYTTGLPDMLMLPAHESRLMAAFAYLKPILIIVDSFRQCNTYDENSAQDMAALMAIFKKWQQFNNTTVILIHHSVKHTPEGKNQSAARGSGEISASADVECTVEDGKITWTKSRSWSIGETKEVTFALVDEFTDLELDSGEIEIVKHVRMKAMSPLPGELETQAVTALIEGLKKRGSHEPIEFDMVRKLVPQLDDGKFKRAMVNARLRKLVRLIRTPKGKKGYVLT